MRLVSKICINDFRSISDRSLEIPSGYLPIVGANNSGKSNILRSLNLFFNDEVEPGVPLRLSTDFHNPQRRLKKELSVAVTFELPAYFKYRKNLKAALDETLGRSFAIRKTWAYSDARSPSGHGVSVAICRAGGNAFQECSSTEAGRAQQFLNLIRFRYHPNHIHPSEVLRQEEKELQAALLFKLNRARDTKVGELSKLFERMSSVAAELMDPISTRLRRATPHIEGIEFSMPKELGDLLFSFVPRIKVKGGAQFEALQHGSGVQSYLTYLMLAFLDSRFESQFGWQQATIWAIEEPESFLHQQLQHRLAALLAELGGGDRFQVLATTHSDVFVRYADQGVLCKLHEGRTSWTCLPRRVLVGEAAKVGVAPYVHPVLFSAQKPLLLVEGETDRRYMQLAYQLLDRLNPWSIRDVASLDHFADLSGVDGLRAYLSANRGALRTRPLEAPCVVLIDWNENEKKVKGLERELSFHPTSRVVQWLESECNRDLHRSFAGIERSLSSEAIAAAESEGLLETLHPTASDTPLHLVKGSLDKTALATFIEGRALRDDVSLFERLIERLDTIVTQAAGEARMAAAGDLFPDS